MPNPTHQTRSPVRRQRAVRVLFSALIVFLTAVVTFVLLRSDLWLGQTSNRSTSFSLNLNDQVTIDPKLMDYQQVASIDLDMQQLRAISSGPQDKIYVAGDQAIHVFSAGGEPQEVINLDAQPQCLTVGDADQSEPGRLFVGSSDGIQILGADHQTLASWPLPDENTVLTSIAVAGDQIFVADAGNRVVWRFSKTGEVLGQIGNPDGNRQFSGFVIPSQYFDIVAGSEGLLACVNPGKLQVLTFSFDGDLGSAWGGFGSSLADFFGCCNPSHIARFADGRFVTSERGIPRIKVYTQTGELESVVAGPQQLGIEQESVGDPRHGVQEAVFDIAVDSLGRVLALDSRTRTVRIFAQKNEKAFEDP